MGVSLIQSNFHGIGSGLSAGDTGVFLHDRGAGFCLVPGHANELAPGNRPAHTLSPTLWTVGGGLRMLLGTRGGSFQPQILLQLIDHMLGSGLDPAEAIRRPRWVVDDEETDRSVVHVESRMGREIVTGLEDPRSRRADRRSLGGRLGPGGGHLGRRRRGHRGGRPEGLHRRRRRGVSRPVPGRSFGGANGVFLPCPAAAER